MTVTLPTIEDSDLVNKGVLGQADTPGLSTEEMQTKVEEVPRSVIIPKFKALVTALISTFSSIYSKTETDAQIDSRIIEIGAGDMAKAVYDTNDNGIVDNAEKVGGQLPSYYSPTGAILAYAGSTAPTGWLLCNGATISRTTYAALFAVLGTTYGAGDGSTTFALPDMRGRVGVGIGANGVTTLGQTGGEQTHVLTVTEMPNHSHGALKTNNATGDWDNVVASGTGTYANKNNVLGYTGGGGAHNNMQPYLGINYIIKT